VNCISANAADSGTYQLLVNVTPKAANAFIPLQQTLMLSVPENWVKYRNLGILAVILLGVGLGVVGNWRTATNPTR